MAYKKEFPESVEIVSEPEHLCDELLEHLNEFF